MTPWNVQAACLGVNPEIFFPKRADSDDAATAAAFCDHCLIAPECLRRALAEPLTHGVRAGRYFDGGKSREITKRPGAAAEPRLPQAKPQFDAKPGRGRPYRLADKAAALARVREVRHRYPSERKTFDAVAFELGLHPVTLGKWAREARRAADRIEAAR